jgi:hypothetical protein
MSIGAAGYGGLAINDGGAATQALTTTAGQIVAWGVASTADGNTRDGNPAVVPDVTNNRLKMLPGIYLVEFDLQFVGGGSADVQAQLYKNGVAVPGLSCRGGASTSRASMGFSGILVVLAADAPGTLQTFPNPSTSGFAGAGGAPYTEVPVTIELKTLASTVTLTLEAAHFTAIQIG